MGLACDTVEVVGFGGLFFFFFLGMATLKRVQVFCRYGNPVESPVCFFFLFAWMGDGGGGGGWVGLHICGA